MPGPVLTLTLARLRRRGATAAVSIAAMAAAAALIAIVSGIGLIASDKTIERTFAAGGPDRPVIRISRFSPSATDHTAAQTSAADAIRRHLGGFTAPVVAGVLGHELADLESPVFELLVAVDDPSPWLTLLEGRLPAPCVDGRRCEAGNGAPPTCRCRP